MVSSKLSVTKTSESLVKPCEPTPNGTLKLSSIDRVWGLRHMVPSLHVFNKGNEPAKVIKEALAKALVKYYPLAGRFVESVDGEVCVECNGEGAWFVEAKAECRLDEVDYFDLEVRLIPLDQVLPWTSADFDATIVVPLMIQMTTFTCGGFVLGLSSCHTITDGLGAGQFLTAMAEISRGLPSLSVDPIWLRDAIPAGPKLQPNPPTLPSYTLQYATIDIPLQAINQLKSDYLLRTSGPDRCSTFDISVAKLWQARTRAINFADNLDVHLCFFADVRPFLRDVLPGGFYGNAFYSMTASSTAGFVANAELVEVVRLIREAKARVGEEFGAWAKGEWRDTFELELEYNWLFVSDLSRVGFHEVDFGWGTPVNVVPLGLQSMMAKGLLTASPEGKKGRRWTTRCVEMEHLQGLLEEMNRFD